MFEITHLEKRNGKIERFNKNKIQAAIYSAFKASNEGNRIISRKVTKLVLEKLNKVFRNRTPKIEEIQDVVEETLMSLHFNKTAKQYIIYRDRRNRERQPSAKKNSEKQN